MIPQTQILTRTAPQNSMTVQVPNSGVSDPHSTITLQ